MRVSLATEHCSICPAPTTASGSRTCAAGSLSRWRSSAALPRPKRWHTRRSSPPNPAVSITNMVSFSPISPSRTSRIDRCEPAAATDHLHESGIRVHRTGRTTLVAFQQLLRVEQVAGTSGAAAALAALDPSTRVAPSPPYVIARSLAQEVRFLVATGRLHTARTLIPRHVDSELAAHVVDLELAAGRVDAARSALDDWADTASLFVPRSSACSAPPRCWSQRERRRQRGSSLQEALDLAEPEGLRRPFLEQPAVLCLLHHEARRASRTFERSIVERARCPRKSNDCREPTDRSAQRS